MGRHPDGYRDFSLKVCPYNRIFSNVGADLPFVLPFVLRLWVEGRLRVEGKPARPEEHCALSSHAMHIRAGTGACPYEEISLEDAADPKPAAPDRKRRGGPPWPLPTNSGKQAEPPE